MNEALRSLPRVDHLLQSGEDLVAVHGREPVRAAIRQALDRHRSALRRAGDIAATPPSARQVLAEVRRSLASDAPQPPQRVVNATGVVVHTNLGRAPLSPDAIAAVVDAAGYCDLEYDLASGRRGSRGAPVDRLLADLVGAPDAMVVNNAAAALVLAVAALAGSRQVVVSRGELIEIGGSFRLPDIIAAAGAELVEVGTTNRTRATDYLAGDDVAMLLRMHPSNYRITGFTAAPDVASLAEVAAARGVPLVHDVGSGLLGGDGPPPPWADDEPTLRDAVSEGADLVIASGDKLLGGPQAGLVVGTAEVVDRCRRHPMARALRVDKLRLAALVSTLGAHRAGRAAHDLPVWRMLTADPATLRTRSEQVAGALREAGRDATVVTGRSVPGGGSAPGAGIDGPVVRLVVDGAADAARSLRLCDVPVIVRIDDRGLFADLRTVDPADDDLLCEALLRC